jgi:hypothetical protein
MRPHEAQYRRMVDDVTKRPRSRLPPGERDLVDKTAAT